jgi:hypothetical protein
MIKAINMRTTTMTPMMTKVPVLTPGGDDEAGSRGEAVDGSTSTAAGSIGERGNAPHPITRQTNSCVRGYLIFSGCFFFRSFTLHNFGFDLSLSLFQLVLI